MLAQTLKICASYSPVILRIFFTVIDLKGKGWIEKPYSSIFFALWKFGNTTLNEFFFCHVSNKEKEQLSYLRAQMPPFMPGIWFLNHLKLLSSFRSTDKSLTH